MEIEAAMAYNKKIIELYGNNYRKNQINIIPDNFINEYINFKIKVNKKPKKHK